MSIEAIKKKLDDFRIEWEASRGCADMTDFSGDVDFLLEQNQRLVEALEYIVDRAPYVEGAHDVVEVAKNALQAYKLLEKKD